VSPEDFVTIGGYFLAAFASGYVVGMLMGGVKSVLEKVGGLGG